MLRLTRSIAAETGMKNLCLAGGVALNCVANGKILRDGKFDNVWIQPAREMRGCLGRSADGLPRLSGARRKPSNGRDRMNGGYLGPVFEQADIERRLTAAGAYTR